MTKPQQSSSPDSRTKEEPTLEEVQAVLEACTRKLKAARLAQIQAGRSIDVPAKE